MSVQVVMPRGTDLATADAFLRSRHLHTTDLPNVGVVLVAGAVRDIESAFGVQLDTWRDQSTGESFYANDRSVRLPFKVDGVLGLDNSLRGGPVARRQLNGSRTITATQLRTVYNAARPDEDGSGQRVAIFVESPHVSWNGVQRDVMTFDRDNGLVDPDLRAYTVGNPLVLPPPSAPAGDSSDRSDEAELDLDVQTVHAMAPGAGIDVLELNPDLPSKFPEFLLAAASLGDHIAAISWGFCESQLDGLDPSFFALLTERLVQAYDMSVFAASGDGGRRCNNTYTNALDVGVNYPASDPSVTAVGGTHLDLTPDDKLNAEQAWDQDEQNASGGGPLLGGVFASPDTPPAAYVSFPRPSWQIGRGVPPGDQRMVPDVAADAGGDNGLDTVLWDGNARQGTSLAAPVWAGVAARYNQVATARGAPLLGLANPLLYDLVHQGHRATFDVTTEQNDGRDLASHAGYGWDAATGLGSPNVGELIADMAVIPPTPAPPQPTGRPNGPGSPGASTPGASSSTPTGSRTVPPTGGCRQPCQATTGTGGSVTLTSAGTFENHYYNYGGTFHTCMSFDFSVRAGNQAITYGASSVNLDGYIPGYDGDKVTQFGLSTYGCGPKTPDGKDCYPPLSPVTITVPSESARSDVFCFDLQANLTPPHKIVPTAVAFLDASFPLST